LFGNEKEEIRYEASFTGAVQMEFKKLSLIFGQKNLKSDNFRISQVFTYSSQKFQIYLN